MVRVVFLWLSCLDEIIREVITMFEWLNWFRLQNLLLF